MYRRIVLLALTAVFMIGCQDKQVDNTGQQVTETKEETKEEETKRVQRDNYEKDIKPLVDDMYWKINSTWNNYVTEDKPVQDLTIEELNAIVVAYYELLNSKEFNSIDLTKYDSNLETLISGLLFNLESVVMERIYALEIVMSLEDITKEELIAVEEHVEMAGWNNSLVETGLNNIEQILE